MAARRKRNQERRAVDIDAMSPLELNAAGIDIGANEHWVAVPPGRAESSVRKFSALTHGLHELLKWLKELGITTVAMESTGVYWVPLYDLLQKSGIKVSLVNARHVKNVPSRNKTDVLDCQWLQKLHTYGLLQASFRPEAAFVQLRTYLRHRGNLIEHASQHIQHMQKALTLMNVQLHHAVSDITGATGMAIIRQIIAGNHDPSELAKFRDHRCSRTEEEIAAALRGEYRAEELFVLRQAVEVYDTYQAKLAECDEQIKKLVEEIRRAIDVSHARELPLAKSKRKKKRAKEFVHDVREDIFHIARGVDLTQLPGLDQLTVLQLLSEIGTDMGRWRTEHHFASWTTLAPSNRITGGKRHPSSRPVSAHRVARILRMAALAAGKTQTALGAFFRRLAVRIGTPKAVVATAAKLARLVYKMLKDGVAYADPGASYYEQHYRQRVIRNLRHRAEALGLLLVPAPQPTESITTG